MPDLFFLPSVFRSSGKAVPIVQAAWASRYMGKLSVTVGGGGGGGRKKGIGGILGLKGAPLLLGGLNSSNPIKSNETVQVCTAGDCLPVLGEGFI